MKPLLLIIFLSVLLISCRQASKDYVINGEVTGLTEGKIYLKSFRNKMFFNIDSTQLINGKFTFEGKTETPLLYGIATESMRYPVQFFLENVSIKMFLDTNEGAVKIEGSPANDLFLENAEKIHDEGFSIDRFVTEHPDSPVAAFYLYRYFTYQLSLDELKQTRNKLSSSLDSCPYVQDLDKIIKQLENIQIGKTAPDFSLPDTAGVTVSLSDFRGKYVLVDFWAGWCPPCRRENPNIVKAYRKYKDKGFTVLGISLDYNKDQWLNAIQADTLTWTHLSDLKYWDSEIPALYGVRGIPANVLLSPEGIIMAKNITGETLHTTLKKIFAIQIAVNRQVKTYPKSTLKDLYKNFFQDKYGPGHIVEDTTAAGNYLRKELGSYSKIEGDVVEPTGWAGNFYRVNLSVLKQNKIPYSVFFNAFIRSVNGIQPPTIEAWKEEWVFIEEVIHSMNLPLPDYDKDKKDIEERLDRGEYVGHHSSQFEEAYSPHYRIISKDIYENELKPLL